MLVADISGLPNTQVPGFVPHGDPLVTGTATLTIYANNTMDYDISLSDDRYNVTQAHFYNINETSGTSGNPAHGDSIICWGGRWENGGDSDEFLQGTSYSNGRLHQVVSDPTNWMLILHTEGGHFGTDAGGDLIPYNSATHETNELGVPETERASRFNNRVGRTLDSLVLHEDNTRDGAAPFHDPTDPGNWNSTPFADSNGVMWTEPNGGGGWQLTADAITNGFDLQTEYLFYLYDDQGPTWDFGGPEGAAGGFLRNPFDLQGDLTQDGEVDTDDWTALMNGYGSDLTGLDLLALYLAGDLNFDGEHTLADITIFREAFIAAGGDASTLVFSGVPEPSGVALLLLSGAAVALGARKRFPATLCIRDPRDES